MKQDRFLLGILIGIGVLVIVALAFFFIRRSQPVAISDSTPDGVVQNYVLAVQKGDYDRAYGYISEASNKPNKDLFRQRLMEMQSQFAGASIQIDDVEINGQNALVLLVVIHDNGGLFGDTYRQFDSANLIQQSGAWKLSRMPQPYWGYDWYGLLTPGAKPVAP
jgi:hypothetical protein